MSVVSLFSMPRRPGEHLLLIPDNTGHTTMTWTPGTEDVIAVRAMFEQMVAGQGFTGYAESDTGELSVIREFDETATRIVVSAPLVGG